MNQKITVSALVIAFLVGLSGLSSAQPRIGDKVAQFQFQATDQNFYGIVDGQNKVTVIYFVGHN